MCGIFAEFTKSSLNSIDVKDEIIDLLKHRGPDNQGLFINESILFGHTRPVSYTHLTLPTSPKV